MEREALAERKSAASGTIELAGLSSPVRVVRDRWGVPHIYAESRDDLFVAQGFVQAQDRLFQIDLWRRSVQGRLSEVLGPNFIERDAMTRRIQYGVDRDAEWARRGPDARAIAAAFVRGINAYVAFALEHPPEEFVLAGWLPSFWLPEDVLNRTDAFPKDAAIAEVARRQLPDVVADAIRRIGAPPFFVTLAAAPTVPLKPDRDRELVPGDAYLPHPARDYLVHLHAPGWNVIGAARPWRPGVVFGHDDRGVVGEGRSTFALRASVGKRDDELPRRRDDGPIVREEAVSATVRIIKDFIVVKGRRRPFEFDTEMTPHGVVIASDKARGLNFTLGWTASDYKSASPALERRDTSVVQRALFVHPLAITGATRRLFNIGPMNRPQDDRPFRVELNPKSWDESHVILAPGQSESPSSPHFADLAELWSAGEMFPLVFSDAAVNGNAEATLTLVPRESTRPK